MSHRLLAVPLVVVALAAAGCGDDDPTAEELEPRSTPDLVVTDETLPEPPTDAGAGDPDTTTSTTPDGDPQGTGGVSPSSPPAAAPAPAPAAPAPAPSAPPQGTGGVSPGGEDQQGGAGDEDPTASPGGVAAP